MHLFDLTRPLSPRMPVYPGDPPVGFRTAVDYEPDGFRVAGVTFGTHAGTHLDAPAHFLPGGRTVDQLPLPSLVGHARVVDLAHLPPQIAPGERLLVRSGWDRKWGSPGYFDRFPGLPEEWVRVLAGTPAALVGLETPSLHPDPERDTMMHHLLLEAGVVIIENLVGLGALPERVMLTALPLPLQGLDGSPCRVIAWPTTEDEVSR